MCQWSCLTIWVLQVVDRISKEALDISQDAEWVAKMMKLLGIESPQPKWIMLQNRDRYNEPEYSPPEIKFNKSFN